MVQVVVATCKEEAMTEVPCKRCGSVDYVKNGMVRGLQRYRCRGCGCNFTATPRRGKPAAMKAVAVLLYAMGNASYGMIGRLFGVSDVAVYQWIRKEAAALPEPEVTGAKIVQLDEMWHFVNGKKTKFGSGKPMILCKGEISPGCSVAVMIEPAANFSIKSALKAGRS